MEALHFGEGNDHPQIPLTPIVHIDTREVTEWSPSEVVHISTTVSFEYQVQEGKHQKCYRLPQPTTNRGNNHHAQLLWARDLWSTTSLQEWSKIQPHIQDALGGKPSSKFSPPGCTNMSHGTHLCSFKRACQDDLGCALQSGRWTFQGRENSGSTAEVFLLAEPSIGHQEVHLILHFLRHCQTIHQEARPLYFVAYP